MCSITGRSSTGTIGLVISYVSGRRRVPSPAARTIALIVGARSPALVAVVVGLERPLDGNADVGRLLGGEIGQAHAERVEVQPRDLLVEVLREHVDPLVVLVVLREE